MYYLLNGGDEIYQIEVVYPPVAPDKFVLKKVMSQSLGASTRWTFFVDDGQINHVKFSSFLLGRGKMLLHKKLEEGLFN